MAKQAEQTDIPFRNQCTDCRAEWGTNEYDARGIYLGRWCHRCRDRNLARYRPDVLTDSSYWADERIEPDDRWP